MKIGVRTPNFKKRLRAKTTGKLKRKVKKAINPIYGKKGMGFVKNPTKSIKNKAYHKVTIDPIKLVTSNSNKIISKNKNYDKNKIIILCSLGFIGLGGIHDFYLGNIAKGLIKLFTINWFLIGTIIDLIKILNNSY